jgi:hypothetical protein
MTLDLIGRFLIIRNGSGVATMLIGCFFLSGFSGLNSVKRSVALSILCHVALSPCRCSFTLLFHSVAALSLRRHSFTPPLHASV